MKVETGRFANKKELFDYLVKNKSELAEFKKAALKFTDCFGVSPMEVAATKALNTNNKDDFENGIIKRTIVGNTYNWMDSHDDVHIDGIFSKSISDRAEKIWHLHDHEYKLTSKVGIPTKVYEKSVNWTDLGVNKIGATQALFMDSTIKKSMNEAMYEAYKNREIDQHSVAMTYVKMDLAINDPEYKEEFAVWNKYIDNIGNKDKAIEKGFFWAQKEAKLKEISAVLEGSNEITPTIPNIQPLESTGNKAEPSKDTHKLDLGYIAQNFKLND